SCLLRRRPEISPFRQRYRRGLARGGIRAGSRTVNEIVESVNLTLAAIRNELNFALITGLEPCRCGRGNVEVQPKRRTAIEFECGIDLEKVEVRPHLHRPVAGIAHLEPRHRPVRIEGDRCRAAYVTAHGHVSRRGIDIGGNRESWFCSGHVDPLFRTLHWIGVCTVTSRLPSVNTA